MIEITCNDRLGKKVRVKCNGDDTIGDLKKLIAAQTGTRADKVVLKKWYTIFKDHITLADYEIHDGMNLELYYQWTQHGKILKLPNQRRKFSSLINPLRTEWIFLKYSITLCHSSWEFVLFSDDCLCWCIRLEIQSYPAISHLNSWIHLIHVLKYCIKTCDDRP